MHADNEELEKKPAWRETEAFWSVVMTLCYMGFAGLSIFHERFVRAHPTLVDVADLVLLVRDAIAAVMVAVCAKALASIFFNMRAFVRNFNECVIRDKELDQKLQVVDSLIRTDDRIIFAPKSDRGISVIGVEEYTLSIGTPHPPSITATPDPHLQNGHLWHTSISILAYERIQDLIFSPEYLDHFFQLCDVSVNKRRILIVNGGSRWINTIRVFLQISQGLKIRTYIYSVGEFNTMLDQLKLLIPDSGEREEIRNILRGNPDLNLTIGDPKDLQEPLVNSKPPQQEYFLRHLSVDGNKLNAFGSDDSHASMPFRRLERLFYIMHAALGAAREGTKALEPLRDGKQPENPWSLECLKLLPLNKR